MSVNVIVCRVGAEPVIETIVSDASRSYLLAMQELVGGFVQCIGLDGGFDVWCNEDAYGLPLNRCIPTVGRSLPPHAFVIDTADGCAAAPGAPAEWRIHGDFFIARSTSDGELAGVTDDDLAKFKALFSINEMFQAEANR